MADSQSFGAREVGPSWETIVPRPLNRVQGVLFQTDEWIPLLCSLNCEGKRIKGNQGKTGTVYQSKQYQSSSGFAAEKNEVFRIVQVEESSITVLFLPDRSERFWLEFPDKASFEINNKKYEGIPIRLEVEAESENTTRVRLYNHAIPLFRYGPKQMTLVCLSCAVFYCDNNRYSERKEHHEDCLEELGIVLSH